MNQEVFELKVRLRTVRERETELLRKVEETRELLAKADARRRQDRDSASRWNGILDNLETSYRQLKQDLDSARISAGRIESELMRLELVVIKNETATIDEVEVMVATVADSLEQELRSGEGENTTDEFSEMDVRIGWRDLIHMTLDDLATLTAKELAQVHEYLKPGRVGALTDADRRLVETRLQLAAELRAQAAPGEVDALEDGERRRQLVLRGAIEKIQNHRTIQMTDEEIRAVIWCQQRLARKSATASVGEKRLLRILDAALSLIRRHRRQVNG